MKAFDVLYKPWSLLSGRKMLLWLLGLWAMLYIGYAIWAKEAFSFFILMLSSNIVFQAPFALFLFSMIANIIRSSIRRFRESALGFFLWIPLSMGIFIFMAGFFISAVYRHTGTIFVMQGDIVKPPWQDVVYVIDGIDPAIKEEFVSGIDDDEKSGGFLGVFKHEPRIVLRRGASTIEVGAFPAKNIDGTYYHILDFGLAPGIRLTDSSGRVIKQGHAVKRLIPPPSADWLELDPLPYEIRMWIEPYKTIEKNRAMLKYYNLKSPHYMIRVERGESTVFENIVKNRAEFEGYMVEFSPPTYWVRLEAAKSPGMPLMYAGIILITVGLPMGGVLAAARVFGKLRHKEP